MLKRSVLILGVFALLVLPAGASAHARPHHHATRQWKHRGKQAQTDTPAIEVLVVDEHLTTPAEEAERRDLLNQGPCEPVSTLEEETPAEPEV